MKKIIVNGQETDLNDLLFMLTDENGEVDFDTLGDAMESEALEQAISEEDGTYGIYDLIESYLKIAKKPLILNI